VSSLPLSLITSENLRTRPIIDGEIRPQGIDLTTTVADPGDMFFRQLHFAEFDVSEMSLSSLLMLAGRGDSPWLGLPIFTIRRFFHTGILVRADAGIQQPADLRGKRVGVPEYQQTAVLWIRGVLQHEFGVAPAEMSWHMERNEDRSHGSATGFRPPPDVPFQYIPPAKSIASMLLGGELDAALFYVARLSLVDRSGVDLRGHPRVHPLFADPIAEGVRYYQKTGLFPINHAMVVRRSLVERHPWVALNLYEAFLAARDAATARLREAAAPYVQLGLLPESTPAALAAEPFPYGVVANRHTLETVARYSHEQGLTARQVPLDEVFAPSTLEV
jgi:4,5-dihydroxyphthalate decarboxylase